MRRRRHATAFPPGTARVQRVGRLRGSHPEYVYLHARMVRMKSCGIQAARCFALLKLYV
jgi:hypothetical protein